MAFGWSWTAHVSSPAPGGHQACRPGCELPADRALGWFLAACIHLPASFPLMNFISGSGAVFFALIGLDLALGLRTDNPQAAGLSLPAVIN